MDGLVRRFFLPQYRLFYYYLARHVGLDITSAGHGKGEREGLGRLKRLNINASINGCTPQHVEISLDFKRGGL